MHIHVENLSHGMAEPLLRKTFEKFGEVKSVDIKTDRYEGKPRTFGDIDMPSMENAKAAIAGLDGKELDGIMLRVHELKPKG